MNASEVLTQLSGLGVSLSVDRGSLIVTATKPDVSDEAWGLVKSHRDELLALLAESAADDAKAFDPQAFLTFAEACGVKFCRHGDQLLVFSRNGCEVDENWLQVSAQYYGELLEHAPVLKRWPIEPVKRRRPRRRARN